MEFNLIITKIQELKDKLNRERQEPQFIKDLRDYAFETLKKKKLKK
ncbi:MAG: hypothetical protein HY602_02975, partial [Parcubacteria group bacterium]|nr:hypothetical protein [Parcubacteria group bacterium]